MAVALPPGTTALLRRALAEDRYRRDRTTQSLVDGAVPAEGNVIAQAAGTLSGALAAATLARIAGLRVVRRLRDGARVRPGSPILTVRGDARRILAVERTMLNLLMHLSGVATETARVVRAVGGQGPGRPVVRATRKTLPGLRDLEKRAVVDGGGDPHRRDLASGVLVKSNHLAVVPLSTVLGRLRPSARSKAPAQFEVRSIAQARQVIDAGGRSLLLDNMTPGSARRVIGALRRENRRAGVFIELSGGITPANARKFARVGADALSLGVLTHSARALPMHMIVRRSRVASAGGLAR